MTCTVPNVRLRAFDASLTFRIDPMFCRNSQPKSSPIATITPFCYRTATWSMRRCLKTVANGCSGMIHTVSRRISSHSSLEVLPVVPGRLLLSPEEPVEIRIYTEPRNIQHTEWALESIHQAMRWDERRYGREYDLDMYMVVAVEHFNMGAMENKGLNIFNTNAVLANADVSTDQGFERVQRVIAHEYFHNWSGNRVTCRDWFQLSLKEGFTVYRDSQFARETNSMATRIDDVAALKERQFPEDAGELAHPVRPSQVSRFNNFYTTTIYEKGAEVVGMMHRLLGDKRYRVGTDLYFSRHDGQAVTTDDFVAALEDASGVDLEQFRLWYTQAGTPRLQINESRSGDRVQLTVTQDCPATPDQPVKQPFHIPLALGMFDSEGSDILGENGQENGYRAAVDSNARFENPDGDGTLIFHLRAPVTEISINGVPDTAGTSVLRDFSAPVNVDFDQPIEQRVTQAVKDPNQYCRWEAVQSLLKDYIGAKVPSVEPIVEIYDVLTRQALDPSTAPETRSVLASTMEIPTELATLDSYPGLALEQLIEARTELRHVLSYSFAERWRDLGQIDRVPQPFRPDLESRSARSMRHLAQYFLLPLEDESNANEYFEGQRDEIQAADNLTDRLASLERILELTSVEPEARSDVVNGFFERWKHERLVVDHWFRIQSQCRRPDGVSRVRDLMRHPAFDISHANSVRAVLNAFATSNIPNFHHLDGRGYGLIVEQVIAIDEFNQTVAARLLTELSRWKRFDGARQSLMCDALRRVRDHATSEDVRDICERSLSDAD